MKFDYKTRNKIIKARVSDEEKILIETKAEYYGYKQLSNYIRDAAIYEKVTNVDLAGKQETYDAYSKNTNEINQIGKDIRHICTYATQFSESERQELLTYMKAIYKNQKDMIKLIDKKLDLDVWQKVNRNKK